MGETIYSKGARFCAQYTDCKDCPIASAPEKKEEFCVILRLKNPLNDLDRSRIQQVTDWAKKNRPRKADV